MPGRDSRLTCGWCDQCSYLLPAKYCTEGERPGCALLFNTARGERARLGHVRDVLAASAMYQEGRQAREEPA
jgi:hypothetical protein